MSLYKSLLRAQAEIKHAIKDATNPHFRNRYATLESVLDEIKPVCNRHGLVVMQTNGRDDHGAYVRTVVVHAETGEKIHSEVYLVLSKQDMQGLGAAITYARRYDLVALFGIGQEDDDGNSAVDHKSFDKTKGAWNSFNKQLDNTKKGSKEDEL